MNSPNVLLGLVPHAGKKFAGRARQAVFSTLLKQLEELSQGSKFLSLDIYYLSTIHGILTEGEKLQSYAFSSSNFSTWPTGTLGVEKFPPALQQEHAYKWVEPELKQAFHSFAKNYHVIFPHEADQEMWLIWLLEKIKIAEKTGKLVIILGTTDLIHYGPEYGLSTFPFPQQLTKLQLEAPLIQSLIVGDPKLLTEILSTVPFVADSPHVLWILAQLVHQLGYQGKVVDYYDSSAITTPLTEHKNILDLYTISWKPVTTFVSYVGIVWTSNNEEKKENFLQFLTEFDILQALGAVRSVIAFDILAHKLDEKFTHSDLTKNTKQIFPSWSVWKNPITSDFGVFVGTQLTASETNCSYGQFPENSNSKSGKKTLSAKIIKAAKNCWSDAADRWQKPYTLKNLETFGKIQFKVELLLPHSSWLWIEGGKNIFQFVTQMFREGSRTKKYYGVQLFVPNIGSATFLPVVAAEWSSGKPEKMAKTASIEYLSALSEKLGGKPDEWQKRDVEAGIYETIAFYWNDRKQTINVV